MRKKPSTSLSAGEIVPVEISESKAPSRNRFGRLLLPEEQRRFEENYGDLSVADIQALAATELQTLVERRREQQIQAAVLRGKVPEGGRLLYIPEDGIARPVELHELFPDRFPKRKPEEGDPEEAHPEAAIPPVGITEMDVIQVAERVFKMTQAAAEQIKGKKISVEITQPEVSEKVRSEVRQFCMKFFAGIRALLCPDCRQRLRNELDRGRLVEIESSFGGSASSGR